MGIHYLTREFSIQRIEFQSFRRNFKSEALKPWSWTIYQFSDWVWTKNSIISFRQELIPIVWNGTGQQKMWSLLEIFKILSSKLSRQKNVLYSRPFAFWFMVKKYGMKNISHSFVVVVVLINFVQNETY